VHRTGTKALVDSFLLSCRILGRQLEHAFLEHCFARLERAWDLTHWHAEFIATRKNEQVQHFWRDFGFEELEALEHGKKYALTTERRARRTIPFISITE